MILEKLPSLCARFSYTNKLSNRDNGHTEKRTATGIALFKKVVGSLVEFLCEISYNKSHRISRNTAEFCTDLHAKKFLISRNLDHFRMVYETKKTHGDYLKLKRTQYPSCPNTPTPMTHTEPNNLGLSEYIVLH
jgi:hypothetical protein